MSSEDVRGHTRTSGNGWAGPLVARPGRAERETVYGRVTGLTRPCVSKGGAGLKSSDTAADPKTQGQRSTGGSAERSCGRAKTKIALSFSAVKKSVPSHPAGSMNVPNLGPPLSARRRPRRRSAPPVIDSSQRRSRRPRPAPGMWTIHSRPGRETESRKCSEPGSPPPDGYRPDHERGQAVAHDHKSLTLNPPVNKSRERLPLRYRHSEAPEASFDKRLNLLYVKLLELTPRPFSPLMSRTRVSETPSHVENLRADVRRRRVTGHASGGRPSRPPIDLPAWEARAPRPLHRSGRAEAPDGSHTASAPLTTVDGFDLTRRLRHEIHDRERCRPRQRRIRRGLGEDPDHILDEVVVDRAEEMFVCSRSNRIAFRKSPTIAVPAGTASVSTIGTPNRPAALSSRRRRP